MAADGGPEWRRAAGPGNEGAALPLDDVGCAESLEMEGPSGNVAPGPSLSLQKGATTPQSERL